MIEFYLLGLPAFANLVLHRITLPCATTLRYSSYANDVTVFMKSKAKIDKVSKEVSRYERVTSAKINHDKSVV